MLTRRQLAVSQASPQENLVRRVLRATSRDVTSRRKENSQIVSSSRKRTKDAVNGEEEHAQAAGNNLSPVEIKRESVEPMDFDDNPRECHAKYEKIESDLLAEALEADKALLASYRNPRVKIKKDMLFSYEFILDRLKEIGLTRYPIDQDEATLGFAYNRYYVPSIYGGSPQDTFPTPAEKRVAEHGISNFAFLSFDWNPHAPSTPGAPGLFFHGAKVDGGRFKEALRVFVNLKGPPTLWLYVGTYEFVPSQSLSIEEFAMQMPKVKETWVTNIKGKEWGLSLLQRIYLRSQLGREPTHEESEEFGVDAKFLQEEVSVEQIMEAYATGQEKIGVYCMKCVGYDADWQKSLIAGYPKWFEEYQLKLAQQKAAREAAKKAARVPTKKAAQKAAKDAVRKAAKAPKRLGVKKGPSRQSKAMGK